MKRAADRRTIRPETVRTRKGEQTEICVGLKSPRPWHHGSREDLTAAGLTRPARKAHLLSPRQPPAADQIAPENWREVRPRADPGRPRQAVLGYPGLSAVIQRGHGDSRMDQSQFVLLACFPS